VRAGAGGSQTSSTAGEVDCAVDDEGSASGAGARVSEGVILDDEAITNCGGGSGVDGVCLYRTER